MTGKLNPDVNNPQLIDALKNNIPMEIGIAHEISNRILQTSVRD